MIMTENEKNVACPCAHVDPCHDHCTCVHSLSSSGCRRCCTYGDDDQQRAAAERIVARELSRDEYEALQWLRDRISVRAQFPMFLIDGSENKRARAALDRLLKLNGGPS